jgi:hypothetical protein
MKLWQNSLGTTANLIHTFHIEEAMPASVPSHHTSSIAWVWIMLRRVFALLNRPGTHTLVNQKASEEAGNHVRSRLASRGYMLLCNRFFDSSISHPARRSRSTARDSRAGARGTDGL